MLKASDVDNATRTPERTLLVSLLHRAYLDVDAEGSNNSREWFDSMTTEPFSFRWVCAQLDLNSSIMRTGIGNRKGRILGIM